MRYSLPMSQYAALSFEEIDGRWHQMRLMTMPDAVGDPGTVTTDRHGRRLLSVANAPFEDTLLVVRQQGRSLTGDNVYRVFPTTLEEWALAGRAVLDPARGGHVVTGTFAFFKRSTATGIRLVD